MLTGDFKRHPHHVHKVHKEIEILKAAAIYGANGSGKSNLIKAIAFLADMVKNGKVASGTQHQKFKLATEYAQKPISAEIEFVVGKKMYLYSVEVDKDKVLSETLSETHPIKEDVLVFERKMSAKKRPKIQVNPKLIPTEKKKYLFELYEDSLLGNNELLLSKSEQINIKQIKEAFTFFNDTLNIIFPETKDRGFIPLFFDDHIVKANINKLISSLSTGINELMVESLSLKEVANEYQLDEEEIQSIENHFQENTIASVLIDGEYCLVKKENDELMVKRLYFHHASPNTPNIRFDLSEESDGTKRLLDFLPMILFLTEYEEQSIFIIDEIDRSIHPALLKTLIENLMKNPKLSGQLIFTTHESNLLDLNIFRQDEIWFAEKDKKGASHFYSLSDFKPRHDLDIEKGYFQGRFGGIPFLGDLQKLNELLNGEEKPSL